MPNDCWNNLTIISHNNKNQLKNLYEEELKDKKKNIIYKGSRGIKIEVWSPNEPNYKWLESLLEKYDECWVKNEWHEEGGKAGVWIGGKLYETKIEIKSMSWEDLTIEGQYYYFKKDE